MAESAVALYGDLNERSVREELGFSPEEAAELDGVEIAPFRLRPGDDTSCLNLYRPQEPRLLGVREALVRRGGFRFEPTAEASAAANPWLTLERPLGPGVIPAFGDANSVRWILHLAPGSELAIADELGRPLNLRIAGLLRRSLFQGELLISEKNFLEHFPSRSGFSFFLIDAPAARVDRVVQLLEARLSRFGFDATSSVERIRAYSAVEETYLSTFQLLGALGLLLGTVGLGVILVRNVLERRAELATLRAFGFRRSRLATMVAAENAFLLVVGIAIGAAAALAAVAPRLALIEVPWTSIAATLALVFATGMLASVAAVSGALATPLLPALKADR